MSKKTLLYKLTPLIRNLTDMHLTLLANFIAYDDTTVRRYSIKENEYRDRIKTLIKTEYNVHMYLDIPGEIPNLNTYVQQLTAQSTLFIEDLLPVMAIFPWKHRNRNLKIDVEDEFDAKFFDEFDNTHTLTFTIKEQRGEWIGSHVYREYVVTPTKYDDERFDLKEDGTPKDVNIDTDFHDIYSEYD